MKRSLFYLILFLLPICSRASHAGGVSITYSHVSGNTYRVILTIYGLCGESNFNNLGSYTPEIILRDGTNDLTTFYLNYLPDSTKNMNPPKCTTRCSSGLNTDPMGIRRYMYAENITLPGQSANYNFLYTSNNTTGCSSRLGRPASGTNWTTGTNSRLMLIAEVNNTLVNNTAPVLGNAGSGTYCVNSLVSFNSQAVDPNGDSLYYQLTPALEQASCSTPQNVPYAAGYSFNNPVALSATNFAFSNLNGTVSFIPTIQQISVIDVKISEYRNGQFVGSTMSEKVFIVDVNCSSNPPTGNFDSTTVQGGQITALNTITTCPGGVIKFSVPAKDVNGDTIKASVTGVPAGSNLTISNNNSSSPKIDFTWNTAGVPPGVYTVTAYFTDNGCPSPSSSAYTYTIIVSGTGTVVLNQTSATNCVRKAKVQYQLSNFVKPYVLTISQGATTIHTFNDTVATINDSLDAGSYTIKLTSPTIPCPTTLNVTVVDGGQYPYMPTVTTPVDYCRNQVADPLKAESNNNGSLKWYDPKGNNIPGPPVPSTSASGTQYYYVTQTYKACESAKDSIAVNVSTDECNYDVHIHNVITPNGDGKNDKWVIENLLLYPKVTVQLFNKLGDKVYEKTNYQNDFDGDVLPSGVFYYVVDLGEPNKVSGKRVYTGYLMIKR